MRAVLLSSKISKYAGLPFLKNILPELVFLISSIVDSEQNILDINWDKFYDENLDCYSVMRNIVFEKYKNKNIFPKGEFFPEIFGLIYSLIYLGKFKGFQVKEPLVLEPLKEESRI